ncbi:MAG TPA: hypothetical protein VFI13_14055 [Gemmatimonadales bacterium]|nr:hypothetical protein [Gemmatimonadales bacterium]
MDPGTLSAVQGFAAISLILVSVAVAVTALRWVWLRTGRPPAPAAHELEELRGRVAELEADRGHMAELEERLDFAERMLAQREPDRLGKGS